MDPNQLQAWLALFSAAYALGEVVVDGVKHIAKGQLTPEENREVLALWSENRARAARNAGIEPPTE
jgi:hypothetical protein